MALTYQIEGCGATRPAIAGNGEVLERTAAFTLFFKANGGLETVAEATEAAAQPVSSDGPEQECEWSHQGRRPEQVIYSAVVIGVVAVLAIVGASLAALFS
ncbi:MAG: hypothetical protein U1G07_01715 [Verrucomicrobiota bacterium]